MFHSYIFGSRPIATAAPAPQAAEPLHPRPSAPRPEDLGSDPPAQCPHPAVTTPDLTSVIRRPSYIYPAANRAP
jgi:hypothetical protein